MANELYQAWTAAGTLYALVRRQSDKYIYQTTTSTFVVWADADIANYDITMAATGRVHFGDFPVVDAGLYDVFICLRAGGTPAITDTFISQGIMDWNGTAEVTLTSSTSIMFSIVSGLSFPASQTVHVYEDKSNLENIAVVRNL